MLHYNQIITKTQLTNSDLEYFLLLIRQVKSVTHPGLAQPKTEVWVKEYKEKLPRKQERPVISRKV